MSREEIINALEKVVDKYFEKIGEIGEDNYNEALDDICVDLNEIIEMI